MMEKLAAAGMTLNASYQKYGTSHATMTQIAQEALYLLDKKGFYNDDYSFLQSLVSSTFDLCSDRTPLWLWRFSSKQTKITPTQSLSLANSTKSSLNDIDWFNLFEDNTKPLIVDLGCGMGVSTLGLSTLQSDGLNGKLKQTFIDGNIYNLDWSKHNFLASDLNAQFIAYAQGIATRWGILGKHIQFLVSSTEDLLSAVNEHYPGPVKLIMIQFPTPYRLQPSTSSGDPEIGIENQRGYNPQLPLDPKVDFMANEQVLRTTGKILSRNINSYLLLQSNCEDVAVTMRKATEEVTSLKCCIDKSNMVTETDNVHHQQVLPRRTKEWMNMGGKRAEGPGWSAVPFVPNRGATETELICQLEGTPIHRCMFKS